MVKIISSTQSLSVLEGTLRDGDGEVLRRHASKSWSSKLLASFRPVQDVYPTWVADWTVPPLPTENERLSHLELFDASAGPSGSVRLHGTIMLEVQGIVVDNILATGTSMPQSGFARMRATIETWLVAVSIGNLSVEDLSAGQKKFRQGDIAKGSLLEAFAATICGGLIHDESISSANGAYRRASNDNFKAFREWSNADQYQPRRTTIIDGMLQGWTDIEANQEANSLQFAIETSSTGRSFFVSERGYMGVGPANIQVGDRICVVLGARVPLILRPKAHAMTCRNEKLSVLVRNPDGSKGAKECSECHHQVYTVVGDAYVHGIMDGELVMENMKRSHPHMSLYLV